MSNEPKKLALLRVLQILEKHSDAEHPIKHDEIVRLLDVEYGITIERKAVGRNISLLNEAGYETVTTKKGSYIVKREFTQTETRLLIDGITSSRYAGDDVISRLAEKLSELLGGYAETGIRNLTRISDWTCDCGEILFENLEAIDRAIDSDLQIKFDYTKIGIDKKLHTTASHTVTPYRILLHNQRYYLIGFQEAWRGVRFYRIDKIRNLSVTENKGTPITSVDGYENGINYSELSTAKPYMYIDSEEPITVRCKKWLFDDIVDWFGLDVKLHLVSRDDIEVTVNSSPNAMVYWAMQYGDSAEIIRPAHIRERVLRRLAGALERYR